MRRRADLRNLRLPGLLRPVRAGPPARKNRNQEGAFRKSEGSVQGWRDGRCAVFRRGCDGAPWLAPQGGCGGFRRGLERNKGVHAMHATKTHAVLRHRSRNGLGPLFPSWRAGCGSGGPPGKPAAFGEAAHRRALALARSPLPDRPFFVRQLHDHRTLRLPPKMGSNRRQQQREHLGDHPRHSGPERVTRSRLGGDPTAGRWDPLAAARRRFNVTGAPDDAGDRPR